MERIFFLYQATKGLLSPCVRSNPFVMNFSVRCIGGEFANFFFNTFTMYVIVSFNGL